MLWLKVCAPSRGLNGQFRWSNGLAAFDLVIWPTLLLTRLLWRVRRLNRSKFPRVRAESWLTRRKGWNARSRRWRGGTGCLYICSIWYPRRSTITGCCEFWYSSPQLLSLLHLFACRLSQFPIWNLLFFTFCPLLQRLSWQDLRLMIGRNFFHLTTETLHGVPNAFLMHVASHLLCVHPLTYK